jgi:aspartyl-tRNA(Asn)/glutamyl-tRNA(Gln) amidotransferase subunit B
MEYELVMGLEVHVELATESKLFCSCSAKFGADANEHVCPACAGMPGMLPIVNKHAVELGIIAALVTNSEIAKNTTFDKKNYYYPDLSTGYQITQFFAPICTNGYVDIETEHGVKKISLKQIHIEEDAGKLVHDYRTDTSLVDYNRASVPLIEIVSNPDFRTAEEVRAYLEKLKSILSFAGVSDCKMQEGSMRCDVNISVRKMGSTELGTRSEIKNMNSLKAIMRAIDYEYHRHVDALENNTEELVQETRRWDDTKGVTFSMRNKEDATDYRYFPNPDIMPILIDDDWIAAVKASLPELAHQKKERLLKLGLSEYDCNIIIGTKSLADIFDHTYEHIQAPKDIANWIIVDLINTAKEAAIAVDDLTINCESLANLISLVVTNVINRNVAKSILVEILKNDVDPNKYIKEHNLGMVSDTSLLDTIIDEVLSKNEKSVQEYKDGNKKVVGFFIGKIMKETEGKADPKMVNQLLITKLDNQ